MLIRIVLLSILVLASCGPRFRIEPLVGEDAEIVAMIGSTTGAVARPETVDAVERFYRAVRSERAGEIWALLSPETREALDALGQKLDTNGRDLLRTRMFPKPGGAKGDTVRVSLQALFMVRRPIRFEAKGTPGAADLDAAVEVANAEGERRVVRLRRDGGEWRVHLPEVKSQATLPPELDLRPKLVPDDPPAPEPKPEAEEDSEPQPDAEPSPEPTPDGPKPDEPPKRKTLDF